MESEIQKYEHLLDLAAVLSQQTDFQEILRVVAQKAASLLNAETATIMMINPQTRNTVKTVMREGGEANDRNYHAARIHVSGWVIKNQKSFASADLKTDSRFAKNLFEGVPVQFVLAVPLRIEGITLGALILLNIKQPASSLQDQAASNLQLEHALSYLEKVATIAAPYLRHAQKIQQYFAAPTDRKGLLEETNRGTLFMDEIANMPIDMQAKFMRVLQEGEVRPVGSNKTRKVNVRIISASSAALRKLVDEQKFREDLFYRLHVYPIHVPSLDERHDDVPLLANYFLKKFAAQQRKQAASFHEEMLDFLQARHWAGNIRELENLVERLVTLAKPHTTILDRDLLPPDLRKEMKKFEAHPQDLGAVKPLNESLAEYEEQVLCHALLANNWNIAKTARALRIAEQTLRYKMGKLGIVRSKA